MSIQKSLLPLAIVAALVLPTAAHAQHAGHVMPPEKQATPPADAETTPAQGAATDGIDHSKMDHSKMPEMDHSKMDHSQMSGTDHSKMGHAIDTPVTPIPRVTDADRRAAFPDVHVHHQHGTSSHSLWLLDRLEVSDGDHGTVLGWEASASIGGDVQKLWLRTEGEASNGRVEHGDIEVLYGRGVRAWWDVVAGVRQDIGDGPSRTWVAFGVQGLAPYKFEVAATAYVGQSGRTAARVETEYDTLFTNRLILQWRAEANAYGKSDPLAGIGSGLSTLEAGLRLRYEVTRQFAPYVGIEHERALGNTADLRRAGGHGAGNTRVVAGVRVWF